MNGLNKKSIEQFTSINITSNQTNLVNDCLKNGVLDYEDIQNLYAGECDESEYDEKEIYSWYLVSYYFAQSLSKKGAPILKSEAHGCTWWGRTTCGQPIYADSVIEDIFSEYKESIAA